MHVATQDKVKTMHMRNWHAADSLPLKSPDTKGTPQYNLGRQNSLEVSNHTIRSTDSLKSFYVAKGMWVCERCE